ncbi:MAG TPA: DUF2971 domain-containing protein [Sedimentisphaerales bacterium]|nr:DUF2971 domain-containing protein [Sedimentisphaerales bacterium]
MYKEHPVLEKPHDENTKVWRYLDFTKFVSLIDKKALFFSIADSLGDPFEGSYSKANIKLRPTVYKCIPKNSLDKIQKQTEVLSKEIRKFTVINCWHMNEYESAAMWKLYLKSNEGVAIQFTFTRLTESLNNYEENDVFVGKVNYINYETEWLPEGNSFYPFLHKRKSFEHERELRAIIQKVPVRHGRVDWSQEIFGIGTYVDVDLNILIEKVLLSPTSPAWFSQLVKSVVKKYNVKKEVIQSSLDDQPVY